MATISTASISPALTVKPSSKLTAFSSSSSIFFSNKLSTRAGRVILADRAQKRGFSCNSLFGLGVPELVVIAGVTVLLFGPKQLPEVGRSFGKTIKSFQQAAKEFETELKKDVDSPVEPVTTTSVSEEEAQNVKAGSS